MYKNIILRKNSGFNMKYHLRITCIIIYLVSWFEGLASQDTVFIHESISKEKIDQYVCYLEDPSKSFTLSDVINKKFNRQARMPFNVGFTGSDYWFELNIKNVSSQNQYLLLELANPSLNKIQVYAIHDNGQIDTSRLLGDQMPFKQRSIWAPTFFCTLDIRDHEYQKIILVISNDNKQLHVPFVLWDFNHYQDHARVQSYRWGSLIGFIILFLFAAGIVCIVSKSRLLFYYFLYTFSFSIYLLALKGIGFQLLWPANTIFQSYALEICKYATGFFFIPFIVSFFNTRTNFPMWHKVLEIMLGSFIIVSILRIIYVYTHLISPSMIMIITQITSIGLILGDMVIWWIAFTSYRNSSKWENLWVLLVCSMFFITLVFMVSLHLGWIPGWNWVENLLVFGYLVEVIVLSTVLAFRYYKLYKANYQLAVDLGQAKEAAIHNFLDGQNEERKRLSEQLHDSISLTLANIKMRLSHVRSVVPEMAVKEIITPLIEDLGNASKEVRNISHSLSPLILKRGNIESALEDLTQRTQWAYPDLKIHWRPIFTGVSKSNIPDHLSQNLYYIASELINNATKHAHAKEIYIDYTKTDHEIELKIKDDGIGYDLKEKIKGLGLDHIRQRVKLLNGFFDIDRLESGMLHKVKFLY